MIKVSYSTIKDLHEFPHTWINKQMGLKTKHLAVFDEGHAVEKVILEHISGKNLDPRISARQEKDPKFRLPEFDTVQEKDFDDRLGILVHLRDDYYLHGWPDMKDDSLHRLGDVKASGTPWSASQVRESMQWKCYGLGYPSAKEVYYVNAARDLNQEGWENTIKVLYTTLSDKNREEAREWIEGGLKVIESGDFKLEKNTGFNKCLYIGCIWCN